jgi:hypothetical protein
MAKNRQRGGGEAGRENKLVALTAAAAAKRASANSRRYMAWHGVIAQ